MAVATKYDRLLLTHSRGGRSDYADVTPSLFSKTSTPTGASARELNATTGSVTVALGAYTSIDYILIANMLPPTDTAVPVEVQWSSALGSFTHDETNNFTTADAGPDTIADTTGSIYDLSLYGSPGSQVRIVGTPSTDDGTYVAASFAADLITLDAAEALTGATLTAGTIFVEEQNRTQLTNGAFTVINAPVPEQDLKVKTYSGTATVFIVISGTL